jgi:hypothetical protein
MSGLLMRALEAEMTEATNDEPKVFSEDYVRTLREENARRRLAEKNVKEQMTRVRDMLGVESEDPGELEKTVARMRGQSEADRETAREALLQAEFAKLSRELDLVDGDAAWRLADRSTVRVDLESRKVEGLREVLEALVREKPYLAGRGGRAGSPGGGTPRSTARQDDDSLSGRIRKQFQKRLPSGMTVPGASIGDLRITR